MRRNGLREKKDRSETVPRITEDHASLLPVAATGESEVYSSASSPHRRLCHPPRPLAGDRRHGVVGTVPPHRENADDQ